MTMEMADGRRLVSQVDYPKGSIENPMSDAELLEKFSSLARGVIGEQRAARLAEVVDGLQHCTNVRSLMKLTVPAG